MANVKVGLLLHFYQPFWQDRKTLARIVDRCYRPILTWVAGHEGFAFTANVNWSLIELLRDNGHDDVIALLQDAVAAGKIELFGTVAHHPIVPLLTDDEFKAQVLRDAAGKESLGLPAKTCGGFYLPEYAFDTRRAKRIFRNGFDFTVADDAHFAAQHGFVPADFVPTVHDGRLAVFLRSRHWGNALSQGHHDFDRFSREFLADVGNWLGGRGGYVILATDAETFGEHHSWNIDWLLRPMLECWRGEHSPVDIVSFTDLLALFPERREMAIPPSSWSTENYDFTAGNWFPLWKDKGNQYHQALWELVDVARGCRGAEVEEDLLKVVSSCFWWWVSGRPYLTTALMMKGARKALEIIEKAGDEKTRAAGRGAYQRLIGLPGINP